MDLSLLPIVSRLLEKVVRAQFTSYLNRRNLFPSTQFAYRNNHSTEDALVYAVTRWQEAKQKRQTTGIVMVDTSKSFDRVGHSKLIADLHSLGILGTDLHSLGILGTALHSLGILGTALAWFCSYMSCLVQSVKIGLKISSEVKCHKQVCWASTFCRLYSWPPRYYHEAFVIRNLLMISSSTHPIQIHMS